MSESVQYTKTSIREIAQAAQTNALRPKPWGMPRNANAVNIAYTRSSRMPKPSVAGWNVTLRGIGTRAKEMAFHLPGEVLSRAGICQA